MIRWTSVLSGLVCVLASSFITAGAQTPWAHPDGTTHWYDVVAIPAGATWNDAQAAARLAGGYLATLTSAAENAFVFGLVDDPAYWATRPSGTLAGPWIGAIQRAGSAEPAGGWVWSSTELMAYTNWSAGQPDDSGGVEHRGHFGEAAGARTPTWNDLAFDNAGVIAAVIEWNHAPDQTVGVMTNNASATDGYTLVPTGSGATYLVDNQGRKVNEWMSTFPNGTAHYLLDNGDLIRAAAPYGNQWNGIAVGGITGRIERFDWNGNLVWEYDLSTSTEYLHHDIEVLPNGNILMIAFERKTAAQAIAQGRDPALLTHNELWPEKVIEIQPAGTNGGNIVWEWHVWDHLVQDFDSAQANFGVVGQHPELVDLNYNLTPIADWLHFNAIDYNPQLDQIVLSSRSFNEIWIIDHSTTTAEAAGHTGGTSGRGGDLLYRWGNPETYRRGTPTDRQLFFQHDPNWVPPGYPGAGNIVLFNNGQGRPDGDYSSADELVMPWDPTTNLYTLPAGGTYGPTAPVWSFTTPHKTDFYSAIVSGAHRLPNGNTFVTTGLWGNYFEVTPAKEVAWLYVSPGTPTGPLTQGMPVPPCGANGFACNFTFRTYKYPATHPGLAGRALVPSDPPELYDPEFAARFGSVNGQVGGREQVLRINGSAGDVWRRVYADLNSTATISLDAPSAVSSTAHYVMYLYFGEPGAGETEVQPSGIGTSCMPMGILNGPPIWPQVTLVNTVAGLAPSLGIPLINLPEAPVSLTTTLIPGTFTFQGLIVDPGSAGTTVSVTNAVVLNVQ